MSIPDTNPRRQFLAFGGKSFLAFLLGSNCARLMAEDAPRGALYADLSDFRELLAPDENGVRLPPGFRSRIIARSGQPVARLDYVWHDAPDGGACFDSNDGGWVYVSNSEVRRLPELSSGGVSAVRFNADGEITDAYSILSGTDYNCAGGKTPWDTWLSCEEVSRGLVYECNPFAAGQGVPRPALGRFKHEAVAVDSVNGQLFLTEDEPDGAFYRFIPDRPLPDLRSGTLQIAKIVDSQAGPRIEWLNVPDAQAHQIPTRFQLSEASHFDGGEGIAWHDGRVYFTTKGDNRVWYYNTRTHRLDILYDANTSPTPHLNGVDNITITASGDVLVAEDGDDMQLVLLSADGLVLPVLQVTGHEGSEISGPAFDPSFQRLYFSSQRGQEDRNSDGMIFEISRIP